jgi:hypothetical protein
MSEPTPRSWSLDERISMYERSGFLKVHFTAHERSVAWSIAAAWHFFEWQQELPDRCLEDSREIHSLAMGIVRMKLMLEGEIYGSISPRTRRWHTTLGEL